MGIQIDLDKCTGCGNCQPVCPFDLIEIIDDKAHIKEGCNLCGACRDACDFDAVIIEEIAPEPAEVSDEHRGVWVFAEQRDGQFKSVGYELVSRGRELADILGTELCAVAEYMYSLETLMKICKNH